MNKITALAAAAVVGLSLAGCQTIDPYTGEKKVSKQTQVGVIGAAVGGILGAAVSKNDRKKGAIIGAGIGALSGAAIGNYMDKQEAELREKLAGTGVSVTRDGDNVILNMPGNVTFDTGDSDLKTNFNNTLDGVVLVLQEYESTLITIEGHTDSTGSETLNQGLSEQRALSVGNYLVASGIQVERVAAVGFGESQPIASNETAAGRASNRRVELTLEPLTEAE